MSPRLAYCLAFVSLLSVLANASGPTEFIASLPGLAVYDSGPVSYKAGSSPGSIIRSFRVRFKNETLREIAEVQVRLRVEQDGRTIYRSNPIPITLFDNVSFPHTGSLLAYNKTQWSAPFPIEYPGRFWNTGSEDHFEIVGCRVYTSAQDLHDPGHLITWLGGHSSTDAIKQYRAHPELMHVRNQRGMTALMMEFAVGDIPTINYLAAHGCSWSDHSTGGTNIVHMAALHDGSHLELALQHVRDIDTRTTKGRTPLMKAIEFGNIATFRWLVQHHANPSAIDSEKLPVAGYAIDFGQKEMLDELVKAGANRKYHDPSGLGWLHYAVQRNYLFLDQVAGYGIRVDDRDAKGGPTPLMLAAESGERTAQVWLLKHGANPKLKDRKGRDCFELAKLSNTLHSDRFFRRAMADAGRG